ncbi:MAG: radical SAM protein [Candidatus Edwardsbacteria bacterium]|nr:radical SAM protein [Candidatus Edwardsbacteria bacterium]MBU1576711.1 radical SAM protein [Candidatus Edwardsbacteria bacterium]MBU2463475.1 radical SAM protein [Candidatus Edwardsbacteria bacterium]MBU2593997.1 radical SAM protein [Candidatus Edwardsbacteria bacterium]
MAKVMLLNPPGDRIYLRDSYCSKVSKAAYLTPPIDLLVISGYLGDRHDIVALDAMADRLTFDSALDKIIGSRPDFIVSLFGLASFVNDMVFFKLIKQALPSVKLIVSGDAGFDDTEKVLRENPAIDAVLLDYATTGWLSYLIGDEKNSVDIAFLSQGMYCCRRSPRAEEYSAGIPRHEIFPYKKYRMPFARKLPYAGVVSDFGCPFKCDFCLIGQLPYKLRPVEEVLEELEYLKDLGIKYFSFGDQTFGVDRKRTALLLEGMNKRKIGLPWGCFSRADLLDDEYLKIFKSAGCDLIMIGVESGSQDILDRHHKGIRLEDLRQAFRDCRRMDIRTLATFIIGLPGETSRTFEQTLKLVLELDPDFASFNLPVAKPLTPLKSLAEKEGWDISSQGDQSTEAGVFSGELSREIMKQWQKVAIRKFYLRPGYFLKRALSMRSLTELRINLQEAAGLFLGGS